MKNKNKIIIAVASLVIIIVYFVHYNFVPRLDVQASTKAIKMADKKIENEKTQKKVIDRSYLASAEIKSKVKKFNIYSQADEVTLFNKGAGIEKNISSGFKEKDYTYIKAHRETKLNNLDLVKVNDVVDVTLKNGEKLKYRVINIHVEKSNNNKAIYTYTNKVGISLSSCYPIKANNSNPNKVLVVDAILI